MKWFKSLFLFLIMFLACSCFASDYTIKWERGKNIDVCIIYFADMGDAETVTFGVDGIALRIVIDAAATDADGDVTAIDISGQNYINLANVCASASEVSYVLNATDSSSNTYGGVPVAGITTLTFTSCGDMNETYIYIYFQK